MLSTALFESFGVQGMACGDFGHGKLFDMHQLKELIRPEASPLRIIGGSSKSIRHRNFHGDNCLR